MKKPPAINAASAAFGALAILAPLAIMSAAPARAAPITTNTALAISKDELLLRQQFISAFASHDPAGLGREFSLNGSISVAGYGLSSKLALFGILPLIEKRLKTPAGHRSARGLGDMRIFARYTLFQQDSPGTTFRIAPFAGLELPTGRNDQSDSLGKLPYPVQLGSGSLDPFAGLVITWASTGGQVDASFSYQNNRKAGGVELGDVFKADLSLQMRLWPPQADSAEDGFLFGLLEANLVSEGKTRLGGIKDANSGGTTLFLSPGLQYASKNWIAEGSVQLPVIQNLGGTRLEKDYVARLSMRFNF